MSIPLPGRVLPLFPRTLGAFRHRNFRLLWIGQFVSLSGRWMQSVAQGWLVLRLTDSAFYLGLVGFCTFAPVLLFALFAGVAADHLPRRRALLWTQGASMVLALLLAALTGFGVVRAWHVAAIAFGVGIAGAFDIPIRQSFLQDLVGRDDESAGGVSEDFRVPEWFVIDVGDIEATGCPPACSVSIKVPGMRGATERADFKPGIENKVVQ